MANRTREGTAIKAKETGDCDGIVKEQYIPMMEAERISYIPFWSHLSATIGTAQDGKAELNKILKGCGFDTVKPLALIKEILSHIHKNATVLDFFAGSGTTGHAAIALNKKDGGNRKYILCTNNENNICEEITYKRLKNIQTKLPHNLKYYKTSFIEKTNLAQDDSLSSKLLNHVKELIQLEHGIRLDEYRHLLILSDEEADFLEEDWVNYREIEGIYISSKVLLTSSQEKLFFSVPVWTIPEYYFRNELREVGELW